MDVAVNRARFSCLPPIAKLVKALRLRQIGAGLAFAVLPHGVWLVLIKR
jgi:hypothetical protein